MATVTKLKAAVNNKNLPILGADGNLYNYYVGRWRAKLLELGYTPTNSELNAVESFVESGIQDGWIDEVKYFMPFIGPQSTPLTGMVPLIDQIADYQLAVETVNEKLFNYSNGKIAGVGGRNDNNNTITNLPFTTSQINSALDYAISFYFDCTIVLSDLDSGLKGNIMRVHNISNNDYLAVRKGGVSASYFNYLYSINGVPAEDSSNIGVTMPTAEETPKELSVMWGVYKRNDTKYRVRSNMRQGDSALRTFNVSEVTIVLPDGTLTYEIGQTNRALPTKINIAAVINPLISADAFLNYSNAVFNLTSALGRR